MKTTVAYFAASRYWNDRLQLDTVVNFLNEKLQSIATETRLIVDGAGMDALAGGDALVVVPLSGAVQKDILSAAKQFTSVALYAAYIAGNVDADSASLMVKNNAAPTLMDCWSVLRKQHPRAVLARNQPELTKKVRLMKAYQSLKGAKLLLIGESEPWVISASRNLDDYRRMGIEVQQIAQSEVAQRYRDTTEAEGKPYYEKYSRSASACVEPTQTDLMNASRMTAALVKLLEDYHADGMAIACFNLLSLGTTSCLGVSYINDCTAQMAACEGDLDSAVTMLMMKRLTDTKPWMANPGLHPKGIVNFSHCTAPLAVDGRQDCPYILRSHHESGVGVSLQVEIPGSVRLTACRVSGVWGTFTAQGATGEQGPREECCRTQLYVRFDDFDRYIRTALGCHQVFCFEDVREDFSTLAKWMNLKPEEA